MAACSYAATRLELIFSQYVFLALKRQARGLHAYGVFKRRMKATILCWTKSELFFLSASVDETSDKLFGSVLSLKGAFGSLLGPNPDESAGWIVERFDRLPINRCARVCDTSALVSRGEVQHGCFAS